ncbi:NAD(P)-binding protein [Pleurostoma richardsiae]|uniref:NAD(P)-binding protein n=1 Tax=Pleurostoma richardsiae TaxID=41990 RepID=A0AA38VHS6_9PEZI|nr:NAD(P)-binding protein [Pleurostoma richardsiae]
MATAAVFGSTGLVGSHILQSLLSTDAVSAVQTISRRAPEAASSANSAKLHTVVDADNSTWASKLASLQPKPSIVLSALGTTRADAGSIEAQWKIDHDLNVDIAKAAKEAGVRTFVFISSAGTRGLVSGAVPYSKMKVGVEDSIKELGFEHAVIVRPGLILGQRERPKTPWVVAFVKGLGRISQVVQDKIGQEGEEIGRAAVKAALLADEGKAPSNYWILDGNDIVKLGRVEKTE